MPRQVPTWPDNVTIRMFPLSQAPDTYGQRTGGPEGCEHNDPACSCADFSLEDYAWENETIDLDDDDDRAISDLQRQPIGTKIRVGGGAGVLWEIVRVS